MNDAELVFVRKELQKELLDRIDLTKDIKDSELLAMIDELIFERSRRQYISVKEKLTLNKDIFNSLRGFDCIQSLIENDSVTEIMVNGPENIFYEKDGQLYQFEKSFDSRKKLEDIVQMIAGISNRAVNESNPVLDCRLKDGSRVNIVMYPVALDGPILTIRKFPQETMTMDRLVKLGSLSLEAAEFLRGLIESRYNIFVSGGTGSGKTTFLNALSNYVPKDRRMITIEDSAELQIRDLPNLIRLEAKPATISGGNSVGIRDMIKASLRMRPDILVIGEVRDAAAIDMLQALNTGHCGMSTGHANSPKDMVSRLETMVLLGESIPLEAVRKQIASAIDVIIHLGRLRDKSRRVLEITEVEKYEDGEVILKPLFEFKESGVGPEGKIQGKLIKVNDLAHTDKLTFAGAKRGDKRA